MTKQRAGEAVRLAQNFGAQGFFGDDEAVGVVVDVGEADPVGAWAKYAQASGASGFEHVGQEQVVAGAVAAGRRGGMREARASRNRGERTHTWCGATATLMNSSQFASRMATSPIALVSAYLRRMLQFFYVREVFDVRLQIARLRNRRHLILGQTINIAAIKTRAGAG